MGLDIYFRKYEDFQKAKELERIQNEYEEKIWEEAGSYGDLTDDQKTEIRNKIKEHSQQIGLDELGHEGIEMDHPQYPEHYFKLGYFRSSYNSAGIERILRDLELPTLSDVFDRDSNDEYEFQPNWQECLTRAEDLLERFKSSSNHRVSRIDSNVFSEPDVHSEAEALRVFLKELGRDGSTEYNYSNAKGEFYLAEPLKVSAAIPGKYSPFGGREKDCVYVIYESDNSWYEQAIKIVIDTLKMVIESPDRDKIYMAWSS